MVRRFYVFALLTLWSFTTIAQIDYTKQYFNGKDLFRQGKYNLAMETFKPLLTYDAKNQFQQYGSFFYALSAYRQGYKAVAKDMFLQIKTQHPQWDKINEVNFWLGKIYVDTKDYFQGFKILTAITDKNFEKDIVAVKRDAVEQITDTETLTMLHEEFPSDAIIGKSLATQLSKDLSSEENVKLLEDIINKFHLKRSEYFPEAPKTFHKEKYSVSVLLPFMVKTLDPTPGKKRNQIILDFYEGMKLAADTLNKQGHNISLRAYDTERNVEKLKQLLNTQELQNTDLIVGPFFPEENKIVQDFSQAQKINVVNPFSNNSETVGNNPHAFLFQPSSETLGKKSAAYLAAHTRRRNVMVFYGPAKKDSVMAANFIENATEHDLKIVKSIHIQNKEVGKILEILATPTEFDEFNYPSQFTLKKDSLGGIYVASDDALIYAKVVGGVEKRADSIKVIGSENWLDDPALDPEKYENLGVILTAPNFADKDKAAYKAFFSNFVKRYGKAPSSFTIMGYELMLFYGEQLKKNGVYFQDALSKTSSVPGYLYDGYNYQYTRDNNSVPFVKFIRGKLVQVEKR